MKLTDKEFIDLEMSILKRAVSKAEKTRDIGVINTPYVKKMILIVEKFLKNGRLVCYGGTAINNILPESAQFYDKTTEFPDYDFYSTDAMNDAKKLADIYYKAGFIDVEAKAGVHYGTYKVFVNFMPVADITQMVPDLFKNILKESILVDGIRYAPPNLLRMGMYLELSRPKGDVSRWEKVLTRISLLNKHYPLKGDDCNSVEFQRKFQNESNDTSKIYKVTRDVFIDEGAVFFGGFASTVYSKYMNTKKKQKIHRDPDFDVIAVDPEKTVRAVVSTLKANGIVNVVAKERPNIGEIIPKHIEITVSGDTIAFVYSPIACHSYNVIRVGGKPTNIATIDTILSMYLAFIYAGKQYYDTRRLICMSEFLFDVQKKARLAQKGVLKRFTLDCYGEQETLESMRQQKTQMFESLRSDKSSDEWHKWFLRYTPGGENTKNVIIKPSTRSTPLKKSPSFKIRKTKTTTRRRVYNSVSKKRGSKKRGSKKRGSKKKTDSFA